MGGGGLQIESIMKIKMHNLLPPIFRKPGWKLFFLFSLYISFVVIYWYLLDTSYLSKHFRTKTVNLGSLSEQFPKTNLKLLFQACMQLLTILNFMKLKYTSFLWFRYSFTKIKMLIYTFQNHDYSADKPQTNSINDKCDCRVLLTDLNRAANV